MYSANNPVNAVDLDGRVVQAMSEKAQNYIVSSVENNYSHLVRFNRNGDVDWKYIKDNLPDDIDVNSNIATLMRMGQNKNILELSVADGYEYKDKDGNVHRIDYYDPKNPNHTNPEGYPGNVSLKGGYTITPDGIDADIDNKYSTNGNIQVFINKFNYNRYKNKATAHELYLHGRFYMLGLPSNHETHDRPNWQKLYEKQAE